MTIKIGSRVFRGRDWSWGDEDGGDGSLGTVVGCYEKGQQQPAPQFAVPGDSLVTSLVNVDWDNGTKGVYRAGFQGAQDLQVVPPDCKVLSEDNTSTKLSYCLLDEKSDATSSKIGNPVSHNSTDCKSSSLNAAIETNKTVQKVIGSDIFQDQKFVTYLANQENEACVLCNASGDRYTPCYRHKGNFIFMCRKCYLNMKCESCLEMGRNKPVP